MAWGAQAQALSQKSPKTNKKSSHNCTQMVPKWVQKHTPRPCRRAPEARLAPRADKTCKSWFADPLLGSLGTPFGHPLGTLEPFLGLRTSKIRGFLDDLFLDRILSRFWAPLGGGRHAIRSCRRMFAKGRPFSKRDRFEVHLEVILESKRGPQIQLYSFWVPLERFWEACWSVEKTIKF